jgi:peptide/nickel transport system substrate-binding protein
MTARPTRHPEPRGMCQGGPATRTGTGRVKLPKVREKGRMRRQSVPIRVGAVLTGLALGLVAAACGSSGGGGSAAQPGGAAPTASEKISHPSDKKGGTLRPLSDADCDYWDPGRTYYAHCLDEERWINRQLLTYAPKPGPAELVPDIATAVPAPPADLMTWKYTLKTGIKFEDGTVITSKDIKYAVERNFATDVINGGPTYFKDFLDDPKDPYPGPYKDTSADKLGLKTVETPDDQTIIFHTNKPMPDWNFVMASIWGSPVPRAKDTGARYTFHPVSSGPYKIESYKPGKSITFVRNDQWDPSTDTVNKALPNRIEEIQGLDLADIDNRIMNGDGDFYTGQTGVQIAAQNTILGNPTLRAQRTTDYITGFLRYLVANAKVKPFDNIHCRLAVAWAVDKTAQQLARGGPVGGGDIATTMLTPPIKYYSKYDLFPTPDGKGDIAKAKEELKACGQPNGFSTTLASRTNGREVRQAEAVQASLKKIGVNVTIDKSDPANYFSAVIGIPDNVHKKGYGLMMAAWGSDWPSPYAFLSSITDGRKILQQGNSNYGELNDPVVNESIDKGSVATDPATAQQEWTKADKAIVSSGVYIPLLYDKALNLYSARATNIYFTPAYLMSDFAQLGVVP